jgi:uncharacterized protein (UPF0262 family)
MARDVCRGDEVPALARSAPFQKIVCEKAYVRRDGVAPEVGDRSGLGSRLARRGSGRSCARRDRQDDRRRERSWIGRAHASTTLALAKRNVGGYLEIRPVLVEIRIDDADWNAASDERRREWSLLIAELIEHHPTDGSGDLRLRIVSGGAETILSLEQLDGTLASRVALSDDVLAPHFRAYLEVCKQMTMLDEGSHSARLEALDMGKKVTHDRAARSILERCGSIVPDHPTARRLFSLLTSLKFDTTQLHCGLPGH